MNKQLKYFQSEVFELNEAIIKYRNRGCIESVVDAVVSAITLSNTDNGIECIAEEIADVMVMLKQIQLYYNISSEDIKKIMYKKIDRQLKRISEEVEKNEQ